MIEQVWLRFVRLLLKVGFLRYVEDKERAPWAYGLCWRDWFSPRALTCPVPFNVVVSLVRWVWMCLRTGTPEHWNEVAARRAAKRLGNWRDDSHKALLRTIVGEMDGLLARNEDEIGSPWGDLQQWRERLKAIAEWR